MFLIDKYNYFSDKIYFHKNIYNFLKEIADDESMPHLLFNGIEGIGKKTMVKMFLEMLFGDDVHNTKYVKYNISSSDNKINDEYFLESNHHIEINPRGNNNDRYLIQDVVKKYAINSSFNMYNSKHNFKIIVIHNIHKMLLSVQFSLRRTIEKYSDKCRFILLTKSLNKVIKPLISRCSCIKMAYPDENNIISYCIYVSKKESINLSLNRLTYILNNSNNLKDILWHLELFKIQDIYIKNLNNTFEQINNIFKSLDIDVKLINDIEINLNNDILNLNFLTKNINKTINTIGNTIFNKLKHKINNYISDYDMDKYLISCKIFMIKFNKKTYKKINYINIKKNKLDEKLIEFKELLIKCFTIINLCVIQTDKDMIYNKLIDLILLKDIEFFDEIRNIFFNLIITNFSGTDIITNILIKIINNDRIKDKHKINIISVCKDVEYNMLKGRREINQFDMLIINIIDILNSK
jgi:replication factor C subunit 3/5